MKQKAFFFIIILIIFAEFSFGQGFFGPGRNRNSGQGNLQLVATASESVKFRYITVGGRLNPARRLDHSVSVTGIVETIFKKEGDRVSVGDSLMAISREAAGETYRPIIVESRISGKISKIYLKEKAEVKSGAIAATIIDDSNFMMTASVSDKDAFQLMQLNIDEIKGDSLDNNIITGNMLSLSAEPDYDNGLFSVSFQFPAQKGARIGMVLFVDLPVKKQQGIFVFQNSLERRFGRNYIWTVTNDKTIKLVPVELGDVFENQVEIKSGLTVGDQYIQRVTGNEKDGMSLEDLGAPARN